MTPIHRSKDWTGTGPSQKEREKWMWWTRPYGVRLSIWIALPVGIIMLAIMWIQHA